VAIVGVVGVLGIDTDWTGLDWRKRRGWLYQNKQ
jgi:hypothetical protein